MTRQIKFRAWDRQMKRMTNEFDLKRSKGIYGTIIGFEGMEIMQFTGLLDKNGKEIYEGDRIMISAVDFSHSFPETIEDIFKAHNLCGESSTHWEVIGNLYENPDLIK